MLLNFSHPLSADQLTKVAELTGQPIDEVRHYMAQFDQDVPFIPQAEALIDQIGLAPAAWQTTPLRGGDDVRAMQRDNPKSKIQRCRHSI